MRLVAIAACSVALLPRPVIASADEASLPTLAPTHMNCADPAATRDPRLSAAQAGDIARSLKAVWKERRNSRGRDLRNYVLSFCETKVGGQSFVVLNGAYTFMGSVLCDDAEGFGVLYDAEKRTFGDILFGVSSCAPAGPTAGG